MRIFKSNGVEKADDEAVLAKLTTLIDESQSIKDRLERVIEQSKITNLQLALVTGEEIDKV